MGIKSSHSCRQARPGQSDPLVRPEASRRSAGFSLIELMVALALLLMFVGMAFRLFDQLAGLNQAVVATAEVSDNLRAAVMMISRDLTTAGSGLPLGGIAVSNGANSTALERPSWTYQTFPLNNGVLSAIMPGSGLGPVSDGKATDEVTILMVDPKSPVYPLTSLTPSGSQVTVDSSINLATAPGKVSVGDLMMISNANGNVLGMVTNVNANSQKIEFAASDPLNINQPSASNGNIAALQNAGSPKSYPPTVAYRISMVSYYISTAHAEPELMRQQNGSPAMEVADGIDQLQLTYDYDDPATGDLLVDQSNVASPNQIRQVHLLVAGRSANQLRQSRDYVRRSLVTSIAVRNLAYRNRYQ